MLAPLHHHAQVFKQLSKDPLFLVMVISCNSIFAFMSMGVSLTENARIDEQLVSAREGKICHRVGTLLRIVSRTTSLAQLYVFGSDMEVQVNIRRCITDVGQFAATVRVS